MSFHSCQLYFLTSHSAFNLLHPHDSTEIALTNLTFLVANSDGYKSVFLRHWTWLTICPWKTSLGSCQSHSPLVACPDPWLSLFSLLYRFLYCPQPSSSSGPSDLLLWQNDHQVLMAHTPSSPVLSGASDTYQTTYRTSCLCPLTWNSSVPCFHECTAIIQAQALAFLSLNSHILAPDHDIVSPSIISIHPASFLVVEDLVIPCLVCSLIPALSPPICVVKATARMVFQSTNGPLTPLPKLWNSSLWLDKSPLLIKTYTKDCLDALAHVSASLFITLSFAFWFPNTPHFFQFLTVPHLNVWVFLHASFVWSIPSPSRLPVDFWVTLISLNATSYLKPSWTSWD